MAMMQNEFKTFNGMWVIFLWRHTHNNDIINYTFDTCKGVCLKCVTETTFNVAMMQIK